MQHKTKRASGLDLYLASKGKPKSTPPPPAPKPKQPRKPRKGTTGKSHPRAARRQAARAGVGSPAEAAALSLMLPKESTPLRLPTTVMSAGLKTGLVKLSRRTTSLCRNDFVGSPEPSKWGWALFRSPTYPLWEYKYVASAPSEGYLWKFSGTLLGKTNYGGADQNVLYDEFSVVTVTTASSLVYPTPLAYESPSALNRTTAPLVLVPPGCLLEFTYASARVATTTIIDLDVYSSSASVKTYSVTYTTTGATGTATVTPAAGFYGWTRIATVRAQGADNPGELTMAVKASSYPALFLYPVGDAIELSNASLIYSATRANAVSALVSNTTPYISMGGVLRGGRLPMHRNNLWGISDLSSAITTVNQSQVFSSNADKGAYTWMVPDESSGDFDNYLFASSDPIQTYFFLTDCSYVNYLEYSGGVISQSGSAGAAVQTFNVELTITLEVATASQILLLDHARLTMNEMGNAVMAAGDRPPFLENPMHLPTLIKAVHQLLRRAYPLYRPLLLSGVDYAYDRVRSLL